MQEGQHVYYNGNFGVITKTYSFSADLYGVLLNNGDYITARAEQLEEA